MRLNSSQMILLVAFASAFTLAPDLQAQRLGAEIDSTYKAAGDVWKPISLGDDLDCSEPVTTIYDADVFELFSDDQISKSDQIGMMVQGNCFNECDPRGAGDSLFFFSRDSGGNWHSPSEATVSEPFVALPLMGDDQICGFDGFGRVNAMASFSGMMGGPAVVSLDGRYYMAFLKGNGDAWSGEVWWAVSDDGRTWDVMEEPMLYGAFHRGHQATGSCPEGFTSVTMTTVTEKGRTSFYIYGTYFHPGREYLQGPGRRVASSLLFRIPYRPFNPYGLGNRWQIYYRERFQPTTGRLVWSYDQAAPRALRLEVPRTNNGWGTETLPFTQSVTRLDDGKFVMLVGAFGFQYPETALYYRVSEDGIVWDETIYELDVTALQFAFSRRGKILVNSEIWQGTLSGQRGTWLFASWSNRCSDQYYHGSAIIPAKVRFR